MNYINMTDTNCAALNFLTPAKKHDQVKHIGLGICDWTQRLKPLLTTSTTTSPIHGDDDVCITGESPKSRYF